MTAAPVPAKAGSHGRKTKTIDELLDEIHMKATNMAESGLRRDDLLVTELDVHGWTVITAVPAKGQSVTAGYPKLSLTKGDKQTIEFHFPTVHTGDCNLTRNTRQIVIRQGKIESDTGGGDDAQPVDDLLANILPMLRRIN